MNFFLVKIALLLSSFLIVGCVFSSSQERAFKKAKITVIREKGRVVFQISETSNGIRFVQVTDEKTNEVLWQIRPRSYKGKIIVYGDVDQFFESSQLPNRVPKQEVPKINRKAPSINGRLIRVRIGIQYDSFMSANIGDIEEVFQIKK